MKIEFLFQGGSRSGERVEVSGQDLIRIGRHPDNDLAFDTQRDLSVSGHHAEVRKEANGYYLYDIGSSNGTFFNGQRVHSMRLASGQEIVFGSDGPSVRVRFMDDTDTLLAEQQPASPGQAVAASIGPDRTIGARTVAMMIDSALQQSRQGSGGVGKSTVFMRSMVNQALTRSTRRFRLFSLLLVLLLLGTVAGFLVLRHIEHREAGEAQSSLRGEMARLMDQQRHASSTEKQRLAQQLERLNSKLMRADSTAAGKAIVQRNLRAVFLLAFDDPAGGAKGFCSAFAVRTRILATNAHCVVALQGFRERGLPTYAVMNRHPQQRYRIVRFAHHPRYHKPRKTISEDVGVLELDADLPQTVQLASVEELRDLESGDLMYMYGFPGRLANVASPSATLVQGAVGRVTGLDGRLGKAEENLLIQHSAFTSGGTSGSPIFNQEGKVMAVNTGGYVEPGSLQVLDPSTGKSGNLMVAKQLAGYNFGIRIDALLGLLADLGK